MYIEISNDPGPGETIYNFKQDQDYVYSRVRNSITFFTYVPPQHSKVIVEYTLLETYIYNVSDSDIL